MTYEQIERALQKKTSSHQVFEIKFKVRSPIKGLFIQTADYQELSKKNLWRIVSESHISEYMKTQNANLSRIFNGIDFTRLEAQL